jgi:hypothetical protein
MKWMTRSGLAVLAGLLAAGAAISADTQPNTSAKSETGGNPTRSCFYARNISSWAPQDDTTVNLRVNVNDYYQLKLLGPCNDINWDEAIGLEHRGTSWICDGLDAVIVTSGRSGPRRCPATSVRKLTKEEVAALPKKAKP